MLLHKKTKSSPKAFKDCLKLHNLGVFYIIIIQKMDPYIESIILATLNLWKYVCLFQFFGECNKI